MRAVVVVFAILTPNHAKSVACFLQHAECASLCLKGKNGLPVIPGAAVEESSESGGIVGVGEDNIQELPPFA